MSVDDEIHVMQILSSLLWYFASLMWTGDHEVIDLVATISRGSNYVSALRTSVSYTILPAPILW